MRLRFGFREFARRLRVGDDAGARLDHDLVVQHQRRPNRDTRIHARCAPTDVADGAGVRAAPLRLQLVDDLHRAHFRGAADRPRGEAGAENIERVVAIPQLTAHFAHEVLHVRVALDLQ